MSRATPRTPAIRPSRTSTVATISEGMGAPERARAAAPDTAGAAAGGRRPRKPPGAHANGGIDERREVLADPVGAGPAGHRLEDRIQRRDLAVGREREDNVAGSLHHIPVALLRIAERRVDLLAPAMGHLERQHALDEELAGGAERARA